MPLRKECVPVNSTNSVDGFSSIEWLRPGQEDRPGAKEGFHKIPDLAEPLPDSVRDHGLTAETTGKEL